MAKFASGKHSRAMCPVCGHEVAYLDLVRRWDGQWVCNDIDCFDIKHEQLDPIKYIYDPEQLDHPWPDNDQGGRPDPNMPQLEALIEFTHGKVLE